MARISKLFINDLISRLDIVDYVDSWVKLKKTGKNYSACCPFHNEKSPSFTVSQTKQFYHCFGCGAHGNIVSFVMEYNHLEFPEAVEELASYANIAVEYEGSSFKHKAPEFDYYAINSLVADLFNRNLMSVPADSYVSKYLKERALTIEAVRHFNIGYAPPGWNYLCPSKIDAKCTEKALTDLSLLSKKETRTFDFFRDRLMFPIRSAKGKVVGFGGRVFGEQKPKYLNSSETPVFNKNEELFGLYELKRSVRSPSRVLIVEGYMDVVSLWSSEVENAVASLGTSVSESQIKKLYRVAPKLTCCFDGDKAGYQAAVRAMEACLPLVDDNRVMTFVFMPDGDDPDTFIKERGKRKFIDFVDETEVFLSDFIFKIAGRDTATSKEAKGAVAAKVKAYLGMMRGSFLKEQIENEISSFLNLSVGEISRKSDKVSGPNFKKNGVFKITPARTACYTMLMFPQVVYSMSSLSCFNDVFSLKTMVAAKEIYGNILALGSTVSPLVLLESLRGSANYVAFNRLLVSPIEVCETGAEEILLDCLKSEISNHLKYRLAELIGFSQTRMLTSDEKKEMMLITKRG